MDQYKIFKKLCTNNSLLSRGLYISTNRFNNAYIGIENLED